MKTEHLLLGLAPWVLFATIATHMGPGAVGYAALIAASGATVLLIINTTTHRATVIDIAAVLTFGTLAAIGLTAGPHTQRLLVDFGRGGSAIVLATVMAVSAATVPFTEQMARSTVSPDERATPRFRLVNRHISLLWAGLIYLMAIGHLTSGYLTHEGLNPRTFLLNWALPVALVMIGQAQTERIVTRAVTPSPTRRRAPVRTHTA